MKPTSVERQFTVALEALVEQIKGDRSVLAAILCGSLSHDTVWAKSDIDLVLVTIDDQKVDRLGRGALRRRRQRPRVPHAARRSSARRSKARSTTRSCTRCSRRGGCSTPTTRRSPICASGCGKIGDRDTRGAAAARGDERAAGDRQGPQVVRHARRPGLHRAVDSLCRDARWRGSRSSARGCWRTAK